MIKTVMLGLTISFYAGLAQANAWDVFVSRCLQPVENVRLELPNDLQLLDISDNDSATKVLVFSLGTEGDQVWMSDTALGGTSFCTIVGPAIDIVAFEDGQNWARQMIEMDRYEVLPRHYSHSPLSLRSTEWREPKIEVHIQLPYATDEAWFTVEETQLES